MNNQNMKIVDNIYNVGCDDLKIDLFESQYKVPYGMRYNSYLIIDEKIAVLDTIDRNFGDEWLNNISAILGDKKPDYLIIHHMEPDHSANIELFLKKYPLVTIVSSAKAFQMIDNFFNKDLVKLDKRLIISENSELSLGEHQLIFKAAPMVHWPEVMVSYETKNKILFSADAFGRFGTYNLEGDFLNEARRYYIGIVGKYGVQVQNLIKKLAGLEINYICSLHGEVLSDKIKTILSYYDIWSKYESEEDGILIAYTSVYKNTEKAVLLLEEELKKENIKVEIRDLARCDMSEAVSLAFKYYKLVLATTTYNMDIFPPMKEFINHLVERNYQNRQIGLIENGSWAPNAVKVMKLMLENSKNIVYLPEVTIKSSLQADSLEQLTNLKIELIK